MEYMEIIFLFIISAISFYYYLHDKNGVPSNWPLVGMLPALLKNINRIHDYFVEILVKTQLTFYFKGPWFTNMHLLATVDPADVHYIMSKNFGNYPKGPKFNEIFDVLGDGFINADDTLWQYHRKMAHSFIGHPNFHPFLVQKISEKIEIGLIPVLDYVSKQGVEVDLQDLLGRFTFDTIFTLILNYDPKSLSIELKSVPPATALDDVEEAIAHRHALPPCVWKFMRWLGVGLEKKHAKACQILDDFVYKCLAAKKQEMSKASHIMASNNEKGNNNIGNIDLLALYMDENDRRDEASKDKFLRDTILNFFIAGRDTTSTALSWFFYLLSKNQQVVSKIRQELNDIMAQKHNDNYSRELYNKLVYLHGALCEALRLYPPVAFQAKSPAKKDILPSGHKVEPNVQIIINMYAMGRMKDIWGDDCCEFKPERWISEQGKIKHVPSSKFFAFNAGPRTCLGKDMAFTQMKAVATTIIPNYDIVAIEGQTVVPDLSVILHMKHGFKVKVVRRLP